MAKNVQIDEQLLQEAVTLGGHKTNRDGVQKAVNQYVGHLKRLEIIKHFGTIDFDPTYDYKKERQMR